MIARIRLAALLALAALTACHTSPPPLAANLSLPSTMAFFRSVPLQGQSCANASNPSVPLPSCPYIAIANGGSNDLSIVNGVNDTLVPAVFPLHGLVYPIPSRPLLLASARIGGPASADPGPDLLVAVSSANIDPNLASSADMGSKLQIISTWDQSGAVAQEVDLGATITALQTLEEPEGATTVRIAAALANDQIAVATFARSTTNSTWSPTSVTTGSVPFQAVDLGVVPGDPAHLYAATPDLVGGVHGVASVNVTGTPVIDSMLNALAPTRRVAGAVLVESIGQCPLGNPTGCVPSLTPEAFTTAVVTTAVSRVYAVLDDSACGLYAPIACGMVALDPATAALVPDPLGLVSTLAPLPFVNTTHDANAAQAFATSGPPQVPPDFTTGSIYGGPSGFVRIITDNPLQARATTAAAGVATADGGLAFVDLGRWELPSQQPVIPNCYATVSSFQGPNEADQQFLTLLNGGTTVPHTDPQPLSSAVATTAGYTPTDNWIVWREGTLPGLSERRTEAGNDGQLWMAMQVTTVSGAVASPSEVVHLYDPVLNVSVGDTVVFDANLIGTCQAFEASITDLIPPDGDRPGGAVHLGHRNVSPQNPTWNACVDELAAQALRNQGGVPSANPTVGDLRATVRAAEYLLVRGTVPTNEAIPQPTGTLLVAVGRPVLNVPISVPNADNSDPSGGHNEDAFAALCLLPPAKPWPPSASDAASCQFGSACRNACDRLIQARESRRIGYLSEPANGDPRGTPNGPAIRFTLALEQPTIPPTRDATLVLSTGEGRIAFKPFPQYGYAVGQTQVVPFDRSPYDPGAGVRFLSLYTNGVVVDASPTIQDGGTYTIH